MNRLILSVAWMVASATIPELRNGLTRADLPEEPAFESGRHRGAKENRTPDLFIANEALYQLSYSP